MCVTLMICLLVIIWSYHATVKVKAKPKKASAVRLGLDNGEFMLTVELGNKKLIFRVEADAVVSLKGDIDKNWSEYEGRPVLNSRGVQEAITIGHLDQ